MHSGPYLLSTEANDLVTATRNLKQVTNESWTFDSSDRTLVLPPWRTGAALARTGRPVRRTAHQDRRPPRPRLLRGAGRLDAPAGVGSGWAVPAHVAPSEPAPRRASALWYGPGGGGHDPDPRERAPGSGPRERAILPAPGVRGAYGGWIGLAPRVFRPLPAARLGAAGSRTAAHGRLGASGRMGERDGEACRNFRRRLLVYDNRRRARALPILPQPDVSVPLRSLPGDRPSRSTRCGWWYCFRQLWSRSPSASSPEKRATLSGSSARGMSATGPESGAGSRGRSGNPR